MLKLQKQIDAFRSQKDYIIKYFIKHGIDKVAIYSATTFIPLIPIYTFIMEELPEHKELCELKLKSLKTFYGETK